MINFENKEAARAAFVDILKKNPALENLSESQIVNSLNIFQNLALEYASHKLERARQESYLSTAYNRNSILSLAQDRQYLPRKATPSRGKLLIRNKQELERSVLANSVFASEDQVYYLIDKSIIVPANNEITVDLYQLSYQEIFFTIENETPFIELELGRDISVNLHKFNVYVDQGLGFEQWLYAHRFRNVNNNDMVFDEFYSFTDQSAIRFGNGIFGQIPPKDSRVKIEIWITEGDTSLMPNQVLTPLDDSLTNLEFETATTIVGGRERESTEELRQNAQYYQLYDDNHVWDDDYMFFIRRHFPEVIWGNAWGEQEQEQIDGRLSQENINGIFVCLFSPDNENITTEVVQFLQTNVPQFNRRYKNVPVNIKTFTATISAKIFRDITIDEARRKIESVLSINYGRNSPSRKKQALIRDLYRLMNQLDIFTNAEDIDISLTGTTKPENLTQMIHIDLEATMNLLNLSY